MLQPLKHNRYKRILATSAIAGALALGVAVPAFATATTVTQGVTAGSRTASVSSPALADINYAHTAQNNPGSMVLTADDSTGSNAGWNVTMQSSAFVWSAGSGGALSGADIPAVNFSLTSAAALTATAGQAVDPTDGPKVPTTSPVGTLDQTRKTAQANAAFGNGTYTQDLGVSLTIPADSAAGTYTGTLTTTISAAP
jgi:hypothetical protein